MTNHASVECRPVAHITVAESACRGAIVDALQRRGWSVVEHATGLHLIHAISGVILGDQATRLPGLIVADAAARGCSGLSIARGLRDLGLQVPVVAVARTPDELATAHGGVITIARPENAARVAESLAHQYESRGDNPSPLQSATV